MDQNHAHYLMIFRPNENVGQINKKKRRIPFDGMRKKFLFCQPLIVQQFRRKRKAANEKKNNETWKLSKWTIDELYLKYIMLKIIGNRSSSKKWKRNRFNRFEIQSNSIKIESKFRAASHRLHSTVSSKLFILIKQIYFFFIVESIKTCIEIDNGFPFKNLNRD